MAAHLKRSEGVTVSWPYVASVWRRHDLKPHRQGTFKVSRDPALWASQRVQQAACNPRPHDRSLQTSPNPRRTLIRT
jgi:hypothetical protein